MTSKRAQHERSKQAIIEAAGRAIAERGVDGFTYAQVAEVAGLNRATLYHYYPDRDALVADALRALLDQLAARGRDSEMRVEQRVRAQIAAPEIARFLFSLMLRRDPLPPLPQVSDAPALVRRLQQDGYLSAEVDPLAFPLILSLAEMGWAVGRESIAVQLEIPLEEADRRVIAELERIVRASGAGPR